MGGNAGQVQTRCGVHPQRFCVVWSRNGRNRSNLLYAPRDSKTYRSGRREAHPVNQGNRARRYLPRIASVSHLGGKNWVAGRVKVLFGYT